MAEGLGISVKQGWKRSHRERIGVLCRSNRQRYPHSRHRSVLFTLPTFQFEKPLERTKLPRLALKRRDGRRRTEPRIGDQISCEEPIKPLLPVAVPVVPQAFGAGVFAAARAVFKKPKHFVQNPRQHVSGFRGISRASGSRIEQIEIRDAQGALIFIADSRDQPITRAQFTGIHVEDPACAERQRLGRCS